PHRAAQLSRADRDAARRGLHRGLASPVRLVARAAWPRPDHPRGLPGGPALLAGGELLRGYGRAPGGAAAVVSRPARLVEGMEEKRRLTPLGAVRTWYDDYFRANGTWPTTAEYAETLLRLLDEPGTPGRRRLLDVACGGGYFLAHTPIDTFERFGIDLSVVAAGEAQRRTGLPIAVGS